MNDEENEGGVRMKNGLRVWMKTMQEAVKELKQGLKEQELEIRALREAGIKFQARIGMLWVGATLVIQLGLWLAERIWK